MKLQDIEREARSLNDRDRASLVVSLIDTLVDDGADVTDEQVDRREAELDGGVVPPLMHEEFVRRVQEERGK